MIFQILVAAAMNPSPAPTRFARFEAWASSNPALVALGGVIIGGFLTVLVWPMVKAAAVGIWEFALERFSRSASERAYLNAVIEQHRFLPILPTTLVPVTTGAQATELDQLYVALTMGDAGAVVTETSAADAIKLNSRLVIVGDPGSGKTTLLRYLTLTFARARRGHSFSRNRAINAADREKVQQARKRVDQEYGFENRPIPIFLYLNRLRDVADWPHDRTLLAYLEEEWKSYESSRESDPSVLRKRFDRGECIFLFDAFDELATDSARAKIAHLIGEFCSKAPPGNRFLVSSRIVGYQGQLAEYGFRTVTVQKLSWNLIVSLVTKWYDVLSQPSLAQRLLDAFKANPRLLVLAENPMLLSLIVLVQYVLPLIPDKRHILYEECVKVLIERRYAPPSIQAQYNELLPSDEASALLRHVAFLMHRKKLREVSRGRLENEFLTEILNGMQLSKAAQLSPQKIVKNIEERSQLLVERGIDEDGKPVMAFSHLTFQEYLASAFIHSKMSAQGKRAAIDELLELYQSDSDWWQEVAVLFAAQLNISDHAGFLESLKAVRQP